MNAQKFTQQLTCLLIVISHVVNLNAQDITIGGTTGNSYFPIYTCYGYNYSQNIYTLAELNAAGFTGAKTISKIRYYCVSTPGTPTNWNSWTVYMGNTATSSFASTSSWISTASMTSVFSGTIATPVGGAWVEITLSTPFTWNGTGNLVVAVDENSASYTCTASWGGYTSSTGNRSLLYYNDTTNPSPSAPPAANLGPGTQMASIQLYAAPTGCTNSTQYPTSSFAAPAVGAGAYTITTLQYQQEYNQMTGALAGNTFSSTGSIAGTYITVHSGTYNGTVVAAGVTPLAWTAAAGGTYFIHYNTNSSCGTASTSMTTTITNTTPTCTNSSQYPSTSFAAPAIGTGAYTITTVQFQQEYNQMTGATAGNSFSSTASIAGTYITVRAGTYNGALVAAGATPLAWTATAGGTYFIHYNTNSSCGTASTSMTTTITNTTPCTQPTTQASIGAFTNNTSGTGVTVNWTRGNGNNVIVVARLTATASVDPTSGSTYTANAAFGSGNTTGTGNYVVYNGSGTTVNVTGLTGSTSYTFTVYEYNTTATCYKTPGSSGAVTIAASACVTGLYTTGCSSSDNIQNISVSNLNQTATGCTGGTGIADYTGTTVSFLQNTTYPFTITCDYSSSEYTGWWIDFNDNNSFGDAGEFIGSSGPGGTTITGNITIPAGATVGNHRMRVRLVYNTAQSLSTSCTAYAFGETHDYTANITAPCTQPTTQASIGAYTNNTTGNSITANWTRGNGTAGVVVVARLTSTTAVDPTSGSTYTANTAFGSGSGSQITGAGNYVVYVGTGTTINVTGLTGSTSYTFTVYEYNTTANCYKTPGSSGAVTTAASACVTGLYTTGCSSNDNIQNISVSNLNQTATGCTGGTGIADYTGTTVNFLQNTTYPFTITCDYSSSEYTGWWIDFNDNSSFGDAGEFIGSSGPGGTTITGNITIPAGAALGNHRMRVRLVYGTAQSLSTSCTAYTYGETHDYTANITAPCTQPTTQASIGAYTNNTTGNSITANWTRGNGTAGVVVVARLTATTAVDPTSGSTYTANTAFGSGSGSQITGAGNYVVYVGTGTTVNVTGLSQGTGYTFTVYEYNTTANCYKTPGSSSAVTTFSYPSVNVPATGNNSVACGTNSNIYDDGGSGANYSDGDNGYTVLNNSGTGVIALSGTYSGIETCCDHLYIYSGVGTGGTLLYSYGSLGSGSITSFSSSPGQSITIQFTSDGSVNGAGFALTAVYSGTCGVDNDNCASAINIASLPYTSAIISNTLATDDSPTSTCDGPYKNIWWKVTGICGTMTAITCTGGTNFDDEMAVFTGSCGSMTHVTCNDDNGAGCTSNLAGVTWTATAGTVYYISVGSYYSSSVTGNIQLNVTASPFTSSVAPTGATGNTTICSGQNTTLTVSGGTKGDGATTEWFTGSCGGTPAGTGDAITVSPSATTTYYVRYNGTCNVTTCAQVTVTVNPQPTMGSVTATPSTICSGSNSTLAASASIPISLTYCTPVINGNPGATGDYLNNFTFANITNNSSGDAASDYTYYSGLTANVVANGTTSYNISLTAGGTSSLYYQQFGIWIDYNQNGVFDAAEFVFSTSSATYSPTSATGAITIPNSAYNGITRMRVMSKYSSVVGSGESCSSASGSYGEYEDYNVSITGGTTNPALAFTYAWSPATFLNSTSGASVTALSATSSQTYTVTATSASNCSNSAQVILTVNQLPAANTASITQCETTFGLGTSSFNLNGVNNIVTGGAGNVSVSWFSNAGLSNSIGAPGAYISGSTTVYAKVTNTLTGCINSAAVTLTVNPLPVANATSLSLCETSYGMGTATFNLNGLANTVTGGAGNVTLNWFSNIGLTNSILTPGSFTSGSTIVYALVTNNSTACNNVAAITLNVNALPTVDAGSYGPLCSNQSPIALSGTPGGGTFSGTGVTGSNFNPAAGTQTITYAYSNGTCANTATTSIQVNTAPTASIDNNSGISELNCLHTTINVSANGGASYSWNGGLGNSANPTITSAGTYTVTATAGNGCTATASIVITSNTAPPNAGVINHSGTTELNCITTGISLTAVGGGTYLWDDNTTSPARIINAAGLYTVVVTGTNGCTASAQIVTTSNTTTPSAGITNNTGTTELNCSTTNISLTATGGGTYAWNGGLGNSSNVDIANAGTYIVTVTAANGCTDLASIIITRNITPPSEGITNNTGTSELTCAVGSISLTANGNGTYQWNDNSSNASRSVSAAGTYTVVVTGSNGCTSSSTIVITSNTTSPTAGITASTMELTCTTTSIDLTATGSGTYTWDDNSANAIRTVSSAGTYTVVVSGSNGCTASATKVITSNTTPPTAGIIAGTMELNCTTASIDLTATGSGTYTWDDNSANALRTVSTAGTYTVVVSAANGCTASATKVITSNTTPPAAGINAGTMELNCTTTSINLTATGGSTYAWDDNSTDPTRTVNSAGAYTVIATGANGCTASATKIITSNTTPPTAGITNNTGTTVLTCSTTSISLTATGGGVYLWDNNSNNANRSVSAAGTYTVVATGENGCTASASVVITSNTTAPGAGINNNTGTAELNCTTTSISLTATGNGAYTWDNSSNNANRSVSAAGVYSVVVTGANGCTSSATIAITSNITPPPAGIANNSGTTVLTCSTTSISLTATGGGAYLWDNNSNIANRSVSAAGTYTVVVTGTNGCTSSATIGITSNTTAPTAGISNNTGTTVLTCSTTSISLTATGSGAYHWDDNSTNAMRTVSAAGTYTVVVTGTNGCTSSANIAITSNTTPPSAGITNNTGTTVLTCVTTSINLTATGGGTYLWNNNSTAAIRSVSAAGTYTVTITGANGCTASAAITITQNPPIVVTATPGAILCYGGSTTVNVSAVGGSGIYTNGTGVFTRSAGTFTFTVTDNVGCTGSTSVTITQPAPLVVTAGNVIGYVGGSPVPLVGSPTTGGTGVFSQPNPFPPTANPSTTNYTYTFTNTNGCMATSSPAIITILPAPTILCPANVTATCGANVCSAVVTVPQPTVADNCSLASLHNSYNNTNNASGTYPVGTTLVSWYAVDCNSNPVSCSMTVKVIDNRIPNITCPGNQNRVGNPATVTLPSPVMNDNCSVSLWQGRYKLGNTWTNWVNATAGFIPGPNPTPGASPLNGNYSPGSYIVQYQDFDPSNNVKVCQFTLTVSASLVANPDVPTVETPEVIGHTGESGRLPESAENQPSLQCYPNPFTDEVNIAFSLASGADVRLSITDLTGHEIGLMANSWLRKGDYNFLLPSENLSAGIYFVRLQVGQKRVIAKVVKL